MPRLLLLLLLLLFCTCVWAVKRGEFTKCHDVGFCRRHRALAEGVSAYHVDPSSINVTARSVRGVLMGPDEVPLSFEIISHPHGVVRWRVTEKQPLRPRFTPTDALLPEVGGESWLGVLHTESGTQDALHITVEGSDVSVELTYDPFRLELRLGDVPAIVANNRGLLMFEPFRSKPAEEDETCDGCWEEKFNSHQDSKPYGPSSVGMDFTFVGARHVYGIPERATSLALKDTTTDSEPYRHYNLDVFEYELHEPMGLYGTVPLMIAHDKGKSTAVFWLNASETYIDVASGKGGTEQTDTHWFSESGALDVFFLMGPTPADIFDQYTSLTGRPALPQLFAIAGHHSRWNYKDEQDIASVDASFDENNIPCDVLWLDIEHTDGKRYFTWDKHHFPTPAKMQEDLAAKGRKMVTIVDPHIKRDTNYYIHKEASDKGFYLRKKDGSEYDGWCWPGSSSYLDMFDPDVREWWASQFLPSKYKGSTKTLYTWIDMNEPSVFNGPEVTMPKENLHLYRKGPENAVEHREIHNMYGFYQAMAAAQGQTAAHGGNDRPFILSRSFFPGSQRYAAIWTGDNIARWDHLAATNPMLLSMGLCGLPFIGADVGGFFKDPDPELLVRWYQAAIYHPFFRVHSHLETRRREPWVFGEPHTTHMRDALRRRYALLPYAYTAFFESSKTGMPVMRPLWVEFPTDPGTFDMEDEFMLGHALLVKPVTEAHQHQTHVYLPGKDPWYDAETGSRVVSQTIAVATPIEKGAPVFQRGGSIIPKKMRPRRATPMMADDPYTLVLALDAKHKARGEVYMDDGKTLDYQRGAFVRRELVFEDQTLHSRSLDNGSGVFQPQTKVERVILFGVTNEPTKVILSEKGNNRPLEFQYDATANKVTIRKPDVVLARDWSIAVL